MTKPLHPTNSPRDRHGRGLTRRQVIGGGAGVAAAALLAGGSVGYFRFLTPSGDVHDYTEYLVDDRHDLRDGQVRVTFLGTTTLLIDDGVTQLLMDAFITDVPIGTAIFGKLSTDRTKVDDVLGKVGADRVRAVFVSHSHYDHSLDAAYVAASTGATLHGSASTLNIGRGGGLEEQQMREYTVGEPLRIGDFTVTVLASKHSPGTKGGDGTPIPAPLTQPAKAGDYLEGGSFDFLVQRGGHSLLVKASAGYLPGALDDVRPEAFFCGTAGTASKDAAYRKAFYDETLAKVKPDVFVPLHWNNFFSPVTNDLATNWKAIDDVAAGWNYAIDQLKDMGSRFAILEGYRSIVLF